MLVRWLVWAVVYMCVGVGEGTGEVGMGSCRSGCSAVPEDLWPYCCESHNTCCQEFAESCMHDCLPRVHTGDVSVVEERPGLCCALYNLCCFRETYRITSRKTGQVQPVSFPIVHRFHTGPIQPQPITLPGLVTRDQIRQPTTEHSHQEFTPKRPNPFRPQPPKKLNRPELPQALTKTPNNVQERNPSGGKILVRDNLQGQRKVTADMEVKKLKSRPKPPTRPTSSLTDGRKEGGDVRKAEEARNNPRESLGPRRPAFQSVSTTEPEERRPGRTGSRRSKVTLKRLRRPIDREEESQGNTRDRSPQGGRQRPSQQGVRETQSQQGVRQRPSQQGVRQRPEQAVRQRPIQQASRVRTEQPKREEQTRKTQVTTARREGRTESAVRKSELDQNQAVSRRVQVRPVTTPIKPQQVQEITVDLPIVVADDQLASIFGTHEIAPQDTDVVQVIADLIQEETIIIDGQQTIMMKGTEETKTEGLNSELAMEKVPGIKDEGDQMDTKMDEESQMTKDVIADQPKETGIIQDASITDTPTEISQEPQIEKQALAPVKEIIKTTSNQESQRSQTRVRSGTTEASQARTRTGGSEGRGRTRVRSSTRGAEPSQGSGRAQTRTRPNTRTTEPSQASGRAQTRTRTGSRGRVRAQQVQSVTEIPTTTRRRSRGRQ